MKRIKNILACLDLTYIDPVLIGYAAFFSESTSAEKVYFLHVIQEYALPEKGGKDLPDTEELYDIIYNKIKDEVDANFGQKRPAGIETRIESEDASAAIIKFISETEIDLLLIGQKYGSKREARYGHKIATGADCDIMFIPEQTEPGIQKILCAIDGSKESETAFQRALDLSEKTGANVAAYFLYDTAQTYFPATTASGSSSRKERFKKQYADFLERFNRPPDSVRCHFREIKPTENHAETSYETAVKEKTDLIIIGAAGDIGDPTTLLGNLLENFNNMEKEIPLLIIKNKKSKRFFFI
ncbi:MAG: universal stress protein [Desulfosalsimonadaceae bacterium]